MNLKTIILLGFFSFSIKYLHSQICSDPLNTIFGLSQKGDIVSINVSNTSVGSSITNSGDAGYPGSTNNSNAIGLDIQNGTFYYFQNNVDNSQQFVSFNPANNTYTLLANSPISGSVVKGCVSADGTGYYCIDANGTLCYYNIAGNSWVKISSNLIDQFNNNLSATFTSLGSGDIAIDGLGDLWIIVSSTTEWGLYKLKTPLPTIATTSLTLEQVIAPTEATPSNLPFAGIAYNATGQIYLSTVNDLYLLQNNLSITHLGTFTIPGVGADLTSCNYPFDILSLSWVSFNASYQYNNSVLLAWSVNQQVNNQQFDIQHSIDEQYWKNIGSLANRQGQGTEAYNFADASPSKGINYYRIKQLDFDGRSSYSAIKTVNLTSNNNISIWPIPAVSTMYIEVQGSGNNGTVQFFNPSGQKILSGLIHDGINNVNVSSLPIGYYVVQVTLFSGEIINQKLVKL